MTDATQIMSSEKDMMIMPMHPDARSCYRLQNIPAERCHLIVDRQTHHVVAVNVDLYGPDEWQRFEDAKLATHGSEVDAQTHEGTGGVKSLQV